MKFAHIADTHIKNLKYHYEYQVVFEELYEKLKEKKVDYIIHCGDIAHTKTQLSPEFIDMCTSFFRNLADIAPTYIILGNHDGNLKNSSRQDALTPIVNALSHPSLFLLKESGEKQLDNGFSINVLSVFDRDNWGSPSDSNRINIALYHGSISNCETDLGWVMTHGEDDISIFEGHDFAFLGDIHKTNQILDKEERIRYAGSTIQQNHGETDDKGFLLWDIKNKNQFTCKHVVLKNPKPFVTIELTKKGRIPTKASVSEKARLRLVSNNNLPLSVMKKAVEVAKHRFNPESVTFLNRAAGTRGNVENLTNGLSIENLRDPVIQKKLIIEYLKDYQPSEELIDNVVRLNLKYNNIIEQGEEIGRNVNWKLNSLEWDNLFNYGENNKINFTKLNGIVGIFGKNYSGKSSIVDSLLYTMYNSTSKNERKNLNIINQNKETGCGKVKISIGNKQYTIERNTEKYIKKLKGEETIEAKTDLNFEYYDSVTGKVVNLNGLSRTETDRNIRKHFGTLEDFLLSSMSSQLESLSFVSEGSTKRKEILARFLDLEIFEKKFKLAKDDASDIRGALKRLEGKEFNEEILEAEQELEVNEKISKEHVNKCDDIKIIIADLEENVSKLEEKIRQIPADLININDVLKKCQEKEEKLTDLIIDVIRINEEVNKKIKNLNKINNFIDIFDIDTLREKKKITTEKTTLLNNISDELCTIENSVTVKKKKKQLLEEVPCGDKYPDCKFICDAHNAGKELVDLAQEIKNLNFTAGELNNKIEVLNPEKINEQLEKYEQVLDKKRTLESDIATKQILVEKNSLSIRSLEQDIEESHSKKDEYYTNKELIDNKELLVNGMEHIHQEIDVQQHILKECEENMLNYAKENGSLKQKLTSLQDQKQELIDLRDEYAAYDLFMRCVHTSGISYDIIKKKLPAINEEVAKVLANVVNFEIFFEDDGKHLKIFIKHSKHEPRPLEMGSGAEKTIAAMAIRLALLSVSNLPKGNIFILDEPGTALDADNMDGFVRILELVKSYFNTVLLISHLDSLKDCVDKQITIDKKGDYAYVAE